MAGGREGYYCWDLVDFVEIYDIQSGTWSEAPNLPDSIVGHCFLKLNEENDIMMVGGNYLLGSHCSPNTDVYVFKNSEWIKQQGEINAGRIAHVCGTLPNGSPFIAGGSNDYNGDILKGGIEVFDTKYGFWQFDVHQLPVEVVKYAFLNYDDSGNVHIVGGTDENEDTTDNVIKHTEDGWKLMDWKLPNPVEGSTGSYSVVPDQTNIPC